MLIGHLRCRNKLQWHFNWNLNSFIWGNTFQFVVWKMAATLYRPQSVNGCKSICMLHDTGSQPNQRSGNWWPAVSSWRQYIYDQCRLADGYRECHKLMIKLKQAGNGPGTMHHITEMKSWILGRDWSNRRTNVIYDWRYAKYAITTHYRHIAWCDVIRM